MSAPRPDQWEAELKSSAALLVALCRAAVPEPVRADGETQQEFFLRQLQADRDRMEYQRRTFERMPAPSFWTRQERRDHNLRALELILADDRSTE